MSELLIDPKEPPLIKDAKEEEFYYERLMNLIRIYKNYLARTSEHDLDDDGGEAWRTQEANGEDFDEHDGEGTLTYEANPNRKDWYDDPKYEKFIYIHGSKHIFDKIIYLENNGINIRKNIIINIVDDNQIISSYTCPIYKAILIDAFYIVITTQMSDDITINLNTKIYKQLKNIEIFDTIMKFVDYHFIYCSQSTKEEVPYRVLPERLLSDIVEISESLGT